MKLKTILVAFALLLGINANAQSLSDILRGLGGGSSTSQSSTASTIGNLLEGIFTKTNLSLDDLVGEYTSTGPAVTFKSDNFLQKAGGIAGAAALETKLKPYYEQYGLTGMTLSVDSDYKFSMNVKGIRLSGTITKGSEEGTFVFNLMVANAIKLGAFTAYVQKSGKNMDLMFDATKLKQLISTVAKFTGGKLIGAMGTLLDSYDGACIGFKMSYTGPASGDKTVAPSDTTSNSSAGGIGSLLNILKNSTSK
ncbi:MAG: DUF4923 family protein [Muribaculaceae bacterium]|nr:DUF4923 family protein [Muribaculaceae bacterium]